MKQPAFKGLPGITLSTLESDKLMKDAFWVGIHQGLTHENMLYVSEKIREFLDNYE